VKPAFSSLRVQPGRADFRAHTSLLPQVQARPVQIAAYDFRGTDEDEQVELGEYGTD
jgi:hypothetical protein